MAPIGIATRSPKHQADEDDVFDTLSMRARSGRAVIEHEGSWSWPILTVDVTNHSICSDSCKTVKITCHIRLPDRVRRGASIESFPPVFQCWCWCAKPCDSIVERKSYSLPMEWLDAFNNKVLKLASRSVRHGPVRYLRCLSSGCGFFFFYVFGNLNFFFSLSFLLPSFLVLFLQVWFKSVCRLIIEKRTSSGDQPWVQLWKNNPEPREWVDFVSLFFAF